MPSDMREELIEGEWERLHEFQRSQIDRWYHLTFIYGGLALAFLAVLLVFAWGCRA